jgi:hypothetical protein
MGKQMKFNFNTLVQYPINALGSITYLSTLFGVLHNPIKTYKEIKTLIKVFYKTPWAKSFFCLSFPKSITHGQKDEIQLQYPCLIYIFGSITYFSTLFGVLHNPTKTYPKDNLLMMYI